ncbi:MAG TPA: LuxR C-terminal-related transcriptional regulator [Dehalococcoidia bacterium]|nr:LuxR C-terminal-related transcriptional regulator [Dehalococcoidia bacterium]
MAVSLPKGQRSRLTHQEWEILRLIALGYETSEIASRLTLSPGTVAGYRGRIRRKLHLHHRHELVHWALEAGLLRDTA